MKAAKSWFGLVGCSPTVPPAVAMPMQRPIGEAEPPRLPRHPLHLRLSLTLMSGPTRHSPPEESSTDRQPAGPIAVTEPLRSVPDAERRQLTVMFCDLMGSTDLASTLDPEDLREVVRRIRELPLQSFRAMKAISLSILATAYPSYFGFPVAHE